MASLYGGEEGGEERSAGLGDELDGERPLFQTSLYFLTMVLILVFAAWGKPAEPAPVWDAVYNVKWPAAIALLAILALMLWRWFTREELDEWIEASWVFVKQIVPLLFAGVLAAGLLMGRPDGDSGLIPASYVAGLVGGNSISANVVASAAGAFMYFATCTEVPIVEGLLGSGMGRGPALALLLAGPALSLPSIIVLRSVMGTEKTVVYCALVVIMATLCGVAYGALQT
jgi:uncharacterized membrane protein YraQ (UPF0718 family)